MPQTPKIKLKDIQELAKIAKEVIPVVQPYIVKYAPKIAEEAQKRASNAADNGKRMKLEFLNGMEERKKSRERSKAAEEARKKTVISSLPPITAKEFFKNFESNVSDDGKLDSGYMGFTGCYAIITMKTSREKDLSAYENVFVGCGKSVGVAVYSQLRGLGNIDVYADFKFGQPMWVLSYPCDEEELGPQFANLLQALQSADSYNKWDLQGLFDKEV